MKVQKYLWIQYTLCCGITLYDKDKKIFYYWMHCMSCLLAKSSYRAGKPGNTWIFLSIIWFVGCYIIRQESLWVIQYIFPLFVKHFVIYHIILWISKIKAKRDWDYSWHFHLWCINFAKNCCPVLLKALLLNRSSVIK